MGDGLDGWGDGMNGLLISIVLGTPLSLILLINLSVANLKKSKIGASYFMWSQVFSVPHWGWLLAFLER